MDLKKSPSVIDIDQPAEGDIVADETTEQSKRQGKNKLTDVTKKSGDAIKFIATSSFRTGSTLIKDFKTFISRGNVIDLAVALVMGAAFTAIVTSIVNDMIMPLVGLAIGGANLENLFVVVKKGNGTATVYPTPQKAQEAGAVTLNYGKFIQTIINFLIISACVFFLMRLLEKLRLQAPKLSNEMECEFCCKNISNKARRCPFCTSTVTPTAAATVQKPEDSEAGSVETKGDKK